MDLSPVDVAVVDSGVDASHPALIQRVYSATKVELTGGGFRLVPLERPGNHDVDGHGTSVAGIVARTAPNARIHDIRIFDGLGKGSGASNVEGFRHAVERGYRVINMSAVGSAVHAAALQELCERAYRRNLVVVAARRSVPRPDLGYPAEFSSCISVGSGTFDSAYHYHYTGKPPIEFIAFGSGIEAPAIGGGFSNVDGTSFAAAVVSGLCALILGACPGLAPFEVKATLRALSSAS